MLLTVESLLRRHEGADVVFEVLLPELNVRAGDFCVFVGASGSGKSTLLDMLGLISAPSGVQRFSLLPRYENNSGQPVQIDLAAYWQTRSDGALAAVRKRQLGYVLQSGGLLPYLSVGQNIDLPRRLCRQTVQRADTEKQMRKIGLAFGYDKPVKQLSGGERQRVAILRALAHRPVLVLADEPTASVDAHRAQSMVALLREYSHERGAAVVMVTHDKGLLDTSHDRIFELTRSPPALRCHAPTKPSDEDGVRSVTRYVALEHQRLASRLT